MRIGVNVVPLRVNSGGARYVFAALFGQLLKLDREHQYIVFAHPAAVGLVREIVQSANDSADFAPSSLLPTPHSPPPTSSPGRVRIVSVVDEELIYPYRDEFDLYFCPINSLKPRIFDRPSVVVLHDIQEQYFPEYFSYADLMSRHEVYPEFCRAATAVVTVSEFCKRSIVEKFGVDPRKIQVVHNAPQADLATSDPNDGGSWSATPVPKPFFFYPANTYPHKNHALLLDAMQILGRAPDAGKAPHAVFTGQPMPGGYPLAEQIKSRNLQEQCHVFTNLSGGEMRYLYRNATAVVMPTMFEGFGMPAIEALACGCPLVCSDTPALREVAGDNALYFPPGDLEGLCARLKQIMSDASLRARLIEDGYAIAGRFTWEAAGRRMLEIFADAGSRFTFGYAGREKTRPRPRIGVLLSNANGSGKMAATIQSLIAAHYENLVVGVVGNDSLEATVAQASRLCPESEKHSRDGCATSNLEVIRIFKNGDNDLQALMDFARQANLDLVGLMHSGNRLRPSGLDSLAMSYADAESSGIHLGEVAVWRGDRYRGIARLRYTGDEMWRIEKLLYPEMFFLSPAALAQWPAGRAILDEGGEDWRWKLLLAARVENQLAIVRRTLADCDRSSLPWLAWIKAFRTGMLDFHRLDNRPAPVPLLRRFERRIRMLSQLLPQSVQHLGTKWWYRLTRSRPAGADHE